jgi:hypothetical protein
VGLLDYYDKVLADATKPWPAVQAKFYAVGGKLPPTGDGIMADLLQDSIAAAIRADRRKLGNIRALRAITALQAFAAELGREATGLDELGLPAAAMADPFSAGPLVARHTDTGWIVYSVADNGVDDGGVFADVRDYGFGPPRIAAAERDEEGDSP